MRTIRLGIIGTGGFANWHAEQYATMHGVRLEACTDLDTARAEAFALKHGFAHVAPTAADLLARCDAVSITTPEAAHAELVLLALKAGRHVLCEKPLTVTLDDARLVAHAARATSVMHMTNFSKRNAPAVVKAIELARSGSLGTIRYAHASYFQSWASTDCWGHWTEPQWLWRLRKPAQGAGGALTDIGSHMLDLLTALTGPISTLRCSLATMPKIHQGKPVHEYQGTLLDANDSAIIELRFGSNSEDTGIGTIQLTRHATGVENQERLEVFGTRGGLRLDLAASPNILHTCLEPDLKASKWTALELPPIPNTCFRFIDAIRTGVPDECDLIRGAEVQSYLDACERSADTGSWTQPIQLVI